MKKWVDSLISIIPRFSSSFPRIIRVPLFPIVFWRIKNDPVDCVTVGGCKMWSNNTRNQTSRIPQLAQGKACAKWKRKKCWISDSICPIAPERCVFLRVCLFLFHSTLFDCATTEAAGLVVVVFRLNLNPTSDLYVVVKCIYVSLGSVKGGELCGRRPNRKLHTEFDTANWELQTRCIYFLVYIGYSYKLWSLQLAVIVKYRHLFLY